jgi:hypothetical protein
LQRDHAAKGMADEMSGRYSLRIQHGQSVCGQLLNCDPGTRGLALPHPAIVKSQAAEMGLDCLRLWKPTVSVKTDSLNKDCGLTTALDLVGQLAPARGNYPDHTTS